MGEKPQSEMTIGIKFEFHQPAIVCHPPKGEQEEEKDA